MEGSKTNFVPLILLGFQERHRMAYMHLTNFIILEKIGTKKDIVMALKKMDV